MIWQWIIVGVLVVAAALYVFRALAPPRWSRKLGFARRTAGESAGACGCSACPPLRSRGSASAPRDGGSR
jgi:hypothetical protein